ncbi:ABC transporter permease [Neobacillus mesonae]|uniref:ABC3 transporter permease C-terminal domain-containing protein n=1 Tax=Neobacillus mesonae TaxID=1193713 RepID=A0A3T0I430_9BACI|nr:FtsX-like permease family protein [Neobacillus mesonae]AZU64109.1 hypothetical protein CHR53_24300 [Neobacillus mesonae]
MIPIYIKKAWKDLARQKGRTIFIVLSLTICLAVIGALFQTNEVFNQGIRQNAERSNTADLAIYTSPFRGDISFLTNISGIKQVEAKEQVRVRIKLHHQFKNFELLALPAQPFFHINQIQAKPLPLKGSSDVLLLEKSTLKLFKLAIGDHVMMSIPGKQPKQLTIKGTVEDVSRIPTRFSGLGYGYVPKEVLADAELTTADNLIHVSFESSLSEIQKNNLIQQIKTKLQSKHITVFRAELSQETLSLRKTVVNTILLLLLLLGIFAFFLGFLLNIHLFQRMVADQVYDLSIQKVLGAASRYLWRQLSAALILLGSIVCILAVSLGGVISYLFTGYLFHELNLGETKFTFSLKVLAGIFALSFLIPILAASFPIRKVLNAPIIQGLQTISRPYGKRKQKHSRRHFHYRVLSFRYALTKKIQLITNILMLSFGGAIIIACMGLNHSLQLTLKEMNHFWDYNSEWSIRTQLPTERLLQSVNHLNGVKGAEAWTSRNAVISHDSAKRNVLLHAVPGQTNFIVPTMEEGQWLDSQVPNGIVISSDIKQILKDIKLGDSLNIQIGQQEKKWEVTGILKQQLTGPVIYMNQPAYTKWIHTSSHNRLLIQKDKGRSLSSVQQGVEKWLTAHNVEIEASDQVQDMKSRPKEIIRLIVYTLLLVGILFAGVGILNLMTTMSINVQERKKEIGIIRSLGGGKIRIYQLFIGEGIWIATVSWACSVALSYPLQALLSNKIGEVLLKSPLNSELTLQGSILWFCVSLFIGIAGSYLPARKAVNKPLSILL